SMSDQQPSAPDSYAVSQPSNPSAPSLPNSIPGDEPPPYNPDWKNEKGTPPVFPGFEQYPEMPPPAYGISQHSVALEDAPETNGVAQRPFFPSYVTFNPQDSRPGTPTRDY
ncbi:unnamed protein product, partial [Meganyctiphanes norvegica]